MTDHSPDHIHFDKEMSKIEERLRALELQQQRTSSHLESEVGNLVRLMSEIRDIIKRHDVMFFGHEGSVGLLTRLDRLEQIEKSRKWMMHAVGATALGLVVKVLWDIILHH
jgi:hypothetical protein